MSQKYDYDAIIIGAGISGLVCGCYLAKAGKKVLIVEKSAKPGGYCTSFKRGGFNFDACAHSLGSLRKGGHISNILKELEIENEINFVRRNPSDIIISPDYKINFWNDSERTVSDLKEQFPHEANQIDQFFNFILNKSGIELLSKLRKKTFKEFLDMYFKNSRLIAILSILILGNIGLPPSLASALTAVTIYKDFICDGGYYPTRGMQALPNLLVSRLKKLGGELFLSKMVEKIETANNKVRGVMLADERFISARYVISNSDARYTYLKMLKDTILNKSMRDQLNSMSPSLSMFVLYVGVDSDFEGLPETASNLWFLPHYDIEDMYHTAIEGDVYNSDWFLTRASKENKNILMLVNASFKTESFWRDNKGKLIDLFIKKVEHLIPGLTSHVVFKDAATPHTLNRYTLNSNGAAYGWSGMPSQLMVKGLAQTTSVENLYLTGHWTTMAQGVSGVSYVGRSTARMIISRGKN